MSGRYIQTLELRDEQLDPFNQKAGEIENSVVQERTDAVKTKADELRTAQKLTLDRPDQIFWDRVAADGVDITEGVPATYLGDAHPERFIGGRDISNGFRPQPEAFSEFDAMEARIAEMDEPVAQLEERRLDELSFAEGVVPWLFTGALLGVRNAGHNVSTLVAPYVHTPDEEQLQQWGQTQETWDAMDIEVKRSFYSNKIANSIEQFTGLSEATKTDRTDQALVTGLGQFAAPMIGVTKFAKAAGVTSNLVADLIGGMSVAPLVTERGEGTIANMAVEFGLVDKDGFVAEYLSTGSDDSTLEQFAKQAITDGLATVAGASIFRGIGKTLSTAKGGVDNVVEAIKTIKGTPRGKYVAEQIKSQQFLTREAERGVFKAGSLIPDDAVDTIKHYANLVTNDILEGGVVKQQFLVDSEKYFSPETAKGIWKTANDRATRIQKGTGFEDLAKSQKVDVPVGTGGKEVSFEFKDGTFHMSSRGPGSVVDPEILKAESQAADLLNVKGQGGTPLQATATKAETAYFESIMDNTANADELLEEVPSFKIVEGKISVDDKDLEALKEFIKGSVNLRNPGERLPPGFYSGDTLLRLSEAGGQ